MSAAARVERWDVFEYVMSGPAEGNPFREQWLTATFQSGDETKCVDGFYDGGGTYRVRFMPSFVGAYRFSIVSSWGGGAEGALQVLPASGENKGPVYVSRKYHFAYGDGSPYLPLGTTCYAWTHQEDAVKRQTLRTLAESCFNKVRFCVFPKHYNFNFRDPQDFPFEGTPCDNRGMDEYNFASYTPDALGNHWDFTRPNPAYFQNLEACVRALLSLGIQADVILFHPYDRWGFSRMGEDADRWYLRYIVARLSAYRNIWWSMANEYDLMTHKQERHWDPRSTQHTQRKSREAFYCKASRPYGLGTCSA